MGYLTALHKTPQLTATHPCNFGKSPFLIKACTSKFFADSKDDIFGREYIGLVGNRVGDHLSDRLVCIMFHI